MGRQDDRPSPPEARVSRAVEARDEFLRVTSHELKTPLAAVQLQLDGLVRLARRPAPDAERMADKAEKAAASLQRLSRLIDELLDVSRLITGRLELAPEPTDLGRRATAVAAQLEAAAARKGTQLRVRASTATSGMWDPARIDQILVALLEGAIARAAGQNIDVTVEPRERAVVLTVDDHGPPLTRAEQAQIFGEFEHVDFDRGISLWMMRRLVDAHGGSLRVDTPGDAGTRFTVELPLGVL